MKTKFELHNKIGFNLIYYENNLIKKKNSSSNVNFFNKIELIINHYFDFRETMC